MARGTSVTFLDRLQNLLEEVAKLNASPDADIEFTQQLRDIVLGKIGVHDQSAGAQLAMSAEQQAPMPADAMATDMLGMGAPPATAAAGEMPPLSRGPRQGLDTSGAIAELERLLAGTNANGVG